MLPRLDLSLIHISLAAASAAWALGLPGHAVETGLASFTGAGRRFEHKGTYHGAEVYDDYAHHPDELHALFTTAKEMGYERLVVAFQPHTSVSYTHLEVR